MLWPIGVIGWGSIPLAFVGFVVLLLSLLNFYRRMPDLSDSDNNFEEVPMNKTSTARILASSVLETVWAIGVGGVVGHLSTKAYSIGTVQ